MMGEHGSGSVVLVDEFSKERERREIKGKEREVDCLEVKPSWHPAVHQRVGQCLASTL